MVMIESHFEQNFDTKKLTKKKKKKTREKKNKIIKKKFGSLNQIYVYMRYVRKLFMKNNLF